MVSPKVNIPFMVKTCSVYGLLNVAYTGKGIGLLFGDNSFFLVPAPPYKRSTQSILRIIM